jgi:hypothetical protein
VEGRAHAEIAVPEHAEAVHAGLQDLLVAPGLVEHPLVVVARGREVREVRAEERVDLCLPGRGVVLVVEVAHVDHGVRALVADQLQHGLGVAAQPLVAEEGDRHVGGDGVHGTRGERQRARERDHPREQEGRLRHRA